MNRRAIVQRAACVVSGILIATCLNVAQAANIIKGVFVDATTGEFLAKPVYVSRAGDDANSGESWTAAKKTIQAGIDAASEGGTVLVGPGEYTETTRDSSSGAYNMQSVAHIQKKIYLKADKGCRVTFITGAWGSSAGGVGDGAKRGVYISSKGAGSVVEGFTIRHCAALNTKSGNDSTSCGAGVCGEGTQETTTEIGATGATAGAAYVVGCTIEDCRAPHGPAIAKAVPINCLFRGNVAVSNGHVGYRCYSAYNCIFTCNGNGSGRLIETAASHMAVNCTYLLNNCDTFAGAAAREPGRAINCAFLANAGESSPQSAFTAINCIGDGSYYAKTNGSGCKDRCSLYQYFSPLADDYAPVAGSDALDGGSDAALADVAWLPDDFRGVDFNGNPRSVGGVDIGAVEAPAGGIVLTAAPLSIGSDVRISVGSVVYEATTAKMWLGFSGTPHQMVRVTSRLAADKTLFGYQVKESVDMRGWNGFRYPDRLGDGGIWLEPATVTDGALSVSAYPAAGVKWVDAKATGTPDGTEESPYPSIQAAINAGQAYDVIYVKPGTYLPPTGESQTVGFNGSRAVRAVGSVEDTVISGNKAVRCVWVNSNDSTINVHVQGFTLKEGYSEGTAGGGFRAKANTAEKSCAIGDSANAQLTDSVVVDNYAVQAGGMYGGWAQRCVFRGNSSKISTGSSNRGSALVFTVASACLVDENPEGQYDQIAYCALYNCTVKCATRNSKGDVIYIFGQPGGIFNCVTIGGYYPAPDPSYEHPRGLIAVEAWNPNSYPTADAYSSAANVIADKESGDYRIQAGCAALWKGGADAPRMRRFAVGGIDSCALKFAAEAAPLPGAYQVPIPVVEVANGPAGVADKWTGAGRYVKDAGDEIVLTRTTMLRPSLGWVADGQTNVITGSTFVYTVPAVTSLDATRISPVDIPCTWYVDASVEDDAADGWTANTPKGSLAAVMRISAAGDVVHAAEGVYDRGEMTNSISFAESQSAQIGSRVCIPSGVTLMADGSRDRTIIEGRYHSATARQGVNALRGVFLYPGAVLDGFTVRNGATTANGGGCYDYNVGGCVATTPANDARGTGTIRNCALRNGGARNAAGVWGGFVSRCLIIGGTCSSDACASMYSAIENSVIINASNTTIKKHCGIRSSTIVSTSTCADRELTAVDDAAVENSIVIVPGHASQAVQTLKNWRSCIFSPVSANSKIQFDGETCADISRYSAAELLIGSADAYRTPKDSPAVDAGDPSLLANLSDAASGDYLGSQRFYNGRPDIGAYEYDWRSDYAASLGRPRRVAVTAADPGIVCAEKGVLVRDGALTIAWTPAKLDAAIDVDVKGEGDLLVYRNNILVGTLTRDSAKTFRVDGLDDGASAEIRFVYASTGDDDAGAWVKGLASCSGMSIVIR